MKPEDAELIPAPARKPDGTFVKGESGNPGGIPKEARKFQRGAAEVSYQLLEVLKSRVAEIKAGTRKMTDRNLLASIDMCAKYGGLMTPLEIMKVVLEAKRSIDTKEEWAKMIAAAFGLPDDSALTKEAA